MIDPNDYIEKGLKAVDEMANRGDYMSALKACEDLLRVNPYHRGAIQTLRNIQTKIEKSNAEKVDRDIESTMPLWKQGKYDELRTIYGKLYAYAPEHKKLRSLIIKLQETVSSETQKQQNEVKQKAIAAIENLLTQKNYDDAITATQELSEFFPLDKDVEKIGTKVRYAKIDSEITSNPQFQNTADFMAAEAFYEGLLKIDPTHPEVKKLLQQTREHDTRARVLDSKIHLNESFDRMKKLWENQEYEKVIQAAEEILQQNEGNLTARMYRSKAHSTLLRESDALEVKQLKAHWQQLGEEYTKNPSSFAKI